MEKINISMELVCLLATLILFFSSILYKGKKTKANKIFIMMLFVNVLLLIEDIIAWSFEGTPGIDGFLYFNASVGYILGNIVSCLLSHYIASSIDKNKIFVKYFVIASNAVCVIASLFVIVSLFTGIYFTYTNGIYERGPMYFLSQAFPIFILATNEIAVVINRKKLGARYTLSLLTYAILPVTAMICQYSYDDLEITYVASSLSLLIIHVFINAEQSRVLLEKENELTQARVDIMLSQIQPHFLYNSLTAIVDICEDNTKAKKALIDFSRYLRINLDSIKSNVPHPFEFELQHIKTYLSLEKMRFQEKLNVVYYIRTTDFSIPALTVQPLVENAVKHGILSKSGVGLVEITAKEDEDCFMVVVSDNGIGFDINDKKNDGKSHIGIENVRQRLMAMSNATLSIISEKNIGTKAIIKIPKETTT